MSEQHRDTILDQFTRQAVPFSTSPNIRNQEALNRIVELSQAGPDDTVLDVACGPGLLACAFARVVRHATGIDMTPAMLDQARKIQQDQSLTNLTWHLGDVLPLSYPVRSFSIVTTRFAFHHIEDPLAVLKEMARVASRCVVVADSAPAASKADAFNAVERLRDPSHVRALPPEELRDLFLDAGLKDPAIHMYRLEGELEDLLARSFPRPGDAAHVRERFTDSLQDDALDMATRRVDGKIHYAFPVAILVSSLV